MAPRDEDEEANRDATGHDDAAVASAGHDRAPRDLPVLPEGFIFIKSADPKGYAILHGRDFMPGVHVRLDDEGESERVQRAAEQARQADEAVHIAEAERANAQTELRDATHQEHLGVARQRETVPHDVMPPTPVIVPDPPVAIDPPVSPDPPKVDPPLPGTPVTPVSIDDAKRAATGHDDAADAAGQDHGKLIEYADTHATWAADVHSVPVSAIPGSPTVSVYAAPATIDRTPEGSVKPPTNPAEERQQKAQRATRASKQGDTNPPGGTGRPGGHVVPVASPDTMPAPGPKPDGSGPKRNPATTSVKAPDAHKGDRS